MGRPEDSRVKIPVLVYFTKEMQVVGGLNSTGEGMNKINTRGKSRENCSSQFWPAKLYQRGNISYTQR